MANGNGSAVGLIILTGMTITAVVGLYAYDVIPRREGIMPSTDIAWPRWQSDQATAPPAQTQSPQPPPYAPPDDQQQSYPPQDQGYGPNQPQYPQDQDVPYDQQDADGVGQPPPPGYNQGQ